MRNFKTTREMVDRELFSARRNLGESIDSCLKKKLLSDRGKLQVAKLNIRA